jgi:hypothetical protein
MPIGSYGFAELARGDEVVRDLGPPRFPLPRMRLESSGELRMRSRSFVLGNTLVDQLSNQEVHEAITLRCDLHQNRSLRSLPRALEVSIFSLARFEQPDVELSANDGTALKRLHTLG